MKLIQLAQMTPAQNAWCAAADDAHRHAFVLGGEIKVLAGLSLAGEPCFAPTIHGIRVRLEGQPEIHATPGEAYDAAEVLKARLRADLGAGLPELDLAALGLEDAPDDEETEVEDEQDLVLALLSFQDLERLETPQPVGKRISLAVDEARLNSRPVFTPGEAGMKSARFTPAPGREERLNPYARPLR